jgi:serine/threonine protein kinase
MVIPAKPSSDLRSRLMSPGHMKRLSDADQKLLVSFVDLLSRTLELDPARRITPKESLSQSVPPRSVHLCCMIIDKLTGPCDHTPFYSPFLRTG